MKIYHNQIFQQYIFVAYLNPTKRIMDALIVDDKGDAHATATLIKTIARSQLEIVSIETDEDTNGNIFLKIDARNQGGRNLNFGAIISSQGAAAEVCKFLAHTFKGDNH